MMFIWRWIKYKWARNIQETLKQAKRPQRERREPAAARAWRQTTIRAIYIMV